jgi:hypothetical protein
MSMLRKYRDHGPHRTATSTIDMQKLSISIDNFNLTHEHMVFPLGLADRIE